MAHVIVESQAAMVTRLWCRRRSHCKIRSRAPPRVGNHSSRDRSRLATRLDSSLGHRNVFLGHRDVTLCPFKLFDYAIGPPIFYDLRRFYDLGRSTFACFRASMS
jgi:hypothetical protein